jgi:hypothetical protein
VIGLINDITIELSENSPENRSLVSIRMNKGRSSEDIKFRTVTGRFALLSNGPPKFLSTIKLMIEANIDTSIEIENKKINFFFENILVVSFTVPVNIAFILKASLF